jgi:hypothetical protein
MSNDLFILEIEGEVKESMITSYKIPLIDSLGERQGLGEIIKVVSGEYMFQVRPCKNIRSTFNYFIQDFIYTPKYEQVEIGKIAITQIISKRKKR